ncbi:MAG: phage tail protein [Chloroflexi bacterium]|nr:MAG: phage tail protein [Chloroflexota bacterium]
MGLLSEQLSQQQPLDRWPGVAPAVVTDTNDPDDVGRVKLKFPWMADDVSSAWARVMGAGAGNEAGLFILPDVGDEVLVSFINGDFDQPCVLGGLWSKTNLMPGEVPASGSGEKPQVRTWHSKTGHILAVYDNSDNKIEILTSGGRSIVLSDKDKKIILSTNAVTITIEDNKLEIDGGTEISLKASSKVTLKADAELKLEGANINIEASGMVAVKGASVQLG